jgi:glutathione S-transferase
MLKLYHAEPVANSVKVLICLFEKNLVFESHYVNLLNFEQHEPEYLAINPDGFVPTLVHDGSIISESSVINEYLDDAFPLPSLKPDNLASRARMRIWTKWIDDYFGPNASRIGWQYLLHPVAKKLGPEAMKEKLARVPFADRKEKWATVAGEGFSEAQLAESRAYVAEGIKRFDALLQHSTWVAGNEYSLADIASYCVVPSLPRLAPDLVNIARTPRILEWLDAMNSRPAVKRALGMPNKVPETLRLLGL